MNCVYYFSGTGHSRSIAEYFYEQLDCDIREISSNCEYPKYETIIAVFPVYCQNVPEIVKSALAQMRGKNYVLIAAYGRKSYGNVLRDAADIVNGRVIAGACVPTSHTYLRENFTPDITKLYPITERIRQPKEALIPKCHKDIFADIFPSIRSQMGIKIKKLEKCSGCHVCTDNCPVGAMHDGAPDKKCIRCLRCVNFCPNDALSVKYSYWLMRYLKKIYKDDFPIFL